MYPVSQADGSGVEGVWQGEGLSSILSGFASTSDYRIFVVHVTELDGAQRSGASQPFTAEGPDLWTTQGCGSSVCLANPACDYFNDIFYPNTGPYTDPFGQTRPRNFRRNYCDNSISWDPNS